jgi:hypothetical protein
MEYEFPHELVAETDTRAGRMFTSGDVRVTVTAPRNKGGEHITIRFKALRDNRDGEGRNWLRVPLNEATHVFMEIPNTTGEWADKVGVFYPRTGKFFSDDKADPERVTAAILAARWLNEGDLRKEKIGGYRLQEESHCGVCGLRLTDPESIDLGIGPECNKRQTNSQHQVKQRKSALKSYSDMHMTADDIIDIIMDMPDEEVEKVRDELNMWHSADSQSTLFDR